MGNASYECTITVVNEDKTYDIEWIDADFAEAQLALPEADRIPITSVELEDFRVSALTLQESEPNIYECLKDGKVTMEDWKIIRRWGTGTDEDVLTPVSDDFPIWIWCAIVICALFLIGIIYWNCSESDRPPQGYERPSHDTHRGYRAPNGMISTYRRRMLERKSPSTRKDPFHDLKTALEIPETPLSHAVEPQVPVVSPSKDLYGVPLNDNIYWILPLSCFTQLVWIFVAHKIYKKYMSHHIRTKNWKPKRYEL